MSNFILSPIGVIESPYKEKFAVPRQPGLVEDGVGRLRLLPPYNQLETVRGLDAFSHIWVLFMFHQTLSEGWHPTVRPPRLGGNVRMGVFATRAPYRPNAIGMSLVKLTGITQYSGEIFLELGSLDLVDGTPVVDIKPYLPFIESIHDATSGFATERPIAALTVTFSTIAETQLQHYLPQYPQLRRFISQVIAQDPRPSYKKNNPDSRIYAMRLLAFTVRWSVHLHNAEILSLEIH